MADETLTLQAEVRDKFTGPLKALRAQLLDASREGAAHGEHLAKGLGKVEGAAKAAGQTAQTVLNPALAALGVTGLGAGVAVAGIAGALRNLTGNLSGLGQLGRETGMAAEQLRVFQSVAGKFGISSDASSAAAQVFARNMRDIRRGLGDTMGFLQSQNPTVATFALKLKNSTNNDEARKLTEDFMEQLPDAQDRKTFAERMFGNADFGRLGDRHLGSISKLRENMQTKMGPLPEGAVESAERYERAIEDLRSSMKKVGTTIAIEMLGPAERFTTWVDDVVAGKRGDATKGLREGIRGIKTELEAINWQQFGNDSLAILSETTALAGKLAESFRIMAETLRDLRKGEYAQALRGADGAEGPLARKLAPRVGDDEIAARENVERLTKLRDVSKDAADHLIGRTQQRMGLLDTPEVAQQKLTAAEAELKRLQARTPEQRQKDFEVSSDKLRRSIDNLSETIKTQQGATAQKSSLDGDGQFGGARIQTAAFTGGGGGFRRPGGIGGGSGPGYVGEQGERTSPLHSPTGRRPRYTGGDFLSSTPGARVRVGPDGSVLGVDDGSGGGSGRLPRMGGGTPRVPQATMPPGTGSSVPTGSDAGNLSALIEREARAVGIDPTIMEGIRAGESGHRHNRGNPRGAYDHNPGTRANPEDSWGPFQLNRLRGLGQDFQRETGLDLSDPKTIPDQARWVARYIRKRLDRNPNYSPFPQWQGFHGRRNADPRWGDSGYTPEGGATAGRIPPIASTDPNFFPDVRLR